ncbi:ATP-binding protein [Singulisphaera rosea]
MKLLRDQKGLTTGIDWDTASPRILNRLRKWQVSALFGDSEHGGVRPEIPLLRLPGVDHSAVTGYIERHILCWLEWSRVFTKCARCDIHELLGNVFQHAKSSIGAIVIGQVHRRAGELQICVCDGGRGLVDMVHSSGFATESAPSAILWAMESGNSTVVDKPSGVGLHILRRRIIEQGGGKIRIYANRGYYSAGEGDAGSGLLGTALQGTLVEFRFRLDCPENRL